MKSKIFSSLVILFISISFSHNAFSTNPLSPEVIESISENTGNSKVGILKQFTFFKKYFKLTEEEKKHRTVGVLALVLGVSSIASLYLMTITAGGWALGAAFILALIGGVTSITALWRTRENPKAHKSTRIMAWIGFATSSFTVLLPTIAVVLLALAFR